MKCRVNQLVTRTLWVRALSFSAIAALALNPALSPVAAADSESHPVAPIAAPKTRFLALGIGQSVIIDLPRDVKDVPVADPKIANPAVPSAHHASLLGPAVAQ